MSEDRERRLAANEALARDVNEVVSDVAASWYDPGERLDFRCECALADCGGRISLTLHEYDSVRANPLHFVVIDGHEDPELERVEGRIREHLIVEKTGLGADVARDTDPRS